MASVSTARACLHLFDVRTELLKAQAHAALDRPSWQLEVRGDLGMRQLAIEGERDHLTLQIRQSLEHCLQLTCIGARGLLLAEIAGCGLERDHGFLRTMRGVLYVSPLSIKSAVAHHSHQPGSDCPTLTAVGAGSTAPHRAERVLDGLLSATLVATDDPRHPQGSRAIAPVELFEPTDATGRDLPHQLNIITRHPLPPMHP